MEKIIFLLIMVISLSSCTQAIHEKQLEKARDSSRISDMKLIESALYQSYQDNSEYPSSLEDITNYLVRIPQDPKNGQIIDGKKYEYIYETYKDNKGMINDFRISTYLESESNIKRLTMDDGIYDDKFDIGTLNK